MPDSPPIPFYQSRVYPDKTIDRMADRVTLSIQAAPGVDMTAEEEHTVMEAVRDVVAQLPPNLTWAIALHNRFVQLCFESNGENQ